MIFISHRGNTRGRDVRRENDPRYVEVALEEGFDVEVDTWIIDGRMYFGHDQPVNIVDEDFIYDNQNHLWFHAQTIETMERLRQSAFTHYFFHKTDDVTITSSGHFWTYIGKPLTPYSICCLPEKTDNYWTDGYWKCSGICSDNISSYKELYKFQETLMKEAKTT